MKRQASSGARAPSSLRALLLLSALACLAPTPGDIGGCGAKVKELDAPRFFEAKRDLDCQRCQSCAIGSDVCRVACAGPPMGDAGVQAFAPQCFPLVHDGEVCLRALQAAACDDYRRYMSDTLAEVPTECNFCPTGGVR